MVVNTISEMLLRFGEIKRIWKRDREVFPMEVRGPLCGEDEHLSGLEESIQVRDDSHPPPRPWGDTFQTPSRCPNPQIVPTPTEAMVLPTHASLG